METKTLYSITENALTTGIFTYLASKSVAPPWGSSTELAADLNAAYYGNYSGAKIISPLVDIILGDDEKLSVADMTKLSDQLMSLNLKNWQKEYATLTAEYDPIKNYDMTEEMSDDETVTEYGKTHTRTDNLSHSDTRTDNLTRTIDDDETTTPAVTRTRQDATRAFNSSSDVNTDKVTESSSGTSTVAKDVTEHDTGTQTNSGTNTGTQTDADTGSDTQTRNYTLTRSGNIGVTTSQQMLQSERDLWIWNYFYNVVFPDVDKLLTIQTY